MKIARFLLQSIAEHFLIFVRNLRRLQMVKVIHSIKLGLLYFITNPFCRKNKALSFTFFYSDICTKFQLSSFSKIFTNFHHFLKTCCSARRNIGVISSDPFILSLRKYGHIQIFLLRIFNRSFQLKFTWI